MGAGGAVGDCAALFANPGRHTASDAALIEARAVLARSALPKKTRDALLTHATAMVYATAYERDEPGSSRRIFRATIENGIARAKSEARS